MKHNRTTLVFVGVAFVLALAAWATAPRVDTADTVSDRGTPFFPRFTDPEHASSLEVFEFDESTFVARPFKITNHNGTWTIPSHYDYPADGAGRLASTAAALIAMTKDDVASGNAADHERCGVLDPLDETLATSQGRGTRVVVRGADESVLADIIIGRPVPGRDEMRYVRIPGQTRTYVSRVGALRISTKVDDWIERDLLQVDRDDMNGIAIQHYVVGTGRNNVANGERLLLRRTARDVWMLSGIAAGERMSTFRMNLLVTTLDALTIVDVRPKPPGLAAALAATGGARIAPADAADLESRGFLTTADGGLVPVGGEVLVRSESGIVFQLRFGDIVHDGGAAGSEDRYLMISAGFTPAAPGGPGPTPDVLSRLALLRARYAPWYYIVSDDSFRRIQLARNDLIETPR